MTYKEELLRLKFGDRLDVIDSIKSAIEEGVMGNKNAIAYLLYGDDGFLVSWLSINGFKYKVDDYEEFVIIDLSDFKS